MLMDEDFNKKVNRMILTHIFGVFGWIFALLYILDDVDLEFAAKFGINVILPVFILLIIVFRYMFIDIDEDKLYIPFMIYSSIGIVLGIAAIIYFFVFVFH